MRTKRWTTCMLLLTFVFVLIISPVSMAKNDNADNGKPNHGPAITDTNNNGHGSGNNHDADNRELNSINKKLDRIEAKLLDVAAQIDEYYNTGDSAPDEDGTADGEDNIDPEDTDSVTDPTDETAPDGDDTLPPAGSDPADGEQPADEDTIGDNAPSADQDTLTDNTAAVTEDPATPDPGQDSPASGETEIVDDSDSTEYDEDGTNTEDPETDEISEDENDTDSDADEVSESDQQEENITGFSFIGKLNALNNNLNSVENRLNAIAQRVDTSSEAYTTAVDRLNDLRARIAAQLEELDDLQSPVLNKLRNRLEEQLTFRVNQNIVAADKVWEIRFNKRLNDDSVTGMNIFVVDSEENIIPTTVSVDTVNNAIIIAPAENYLPGTYTLFISRDISSSSRAQLKKAVKVTFTVAAE